VNLSTLIRQCFHGSAHNWTPTHHRPGTPYLLQREHVDAVIQNWQGGPEFAAVQIPANANNILLDEVQHWVNTNLTVYSSVRTVLQHFQHLVSWELSQYEAGEKWCNRHAVALLEACQYWEPHLVGGVVCACAANAMIPWLVSTFANAFPLVHDAYQVPGMILYFVIVVLCWKSCYSCI
jgi:hypothetical protein